MEKIYLDKKYEKNYYLHDEKVFERIKELVGFMPNYQIGNTQNIKHTDVFYETSGRLLNQLDASVRIRIEGDNQTLSIVCKNNGEKREFEMPMKYKEKIQDRLEYLIFLEDKLQDIYTHRIDANIIRLLKDLKPFLFIETNRTRYEIMNNLGLKFFLDYDKTNFKTKRHSVDDFIMEIKLKSVADVQNLTAYNRFIDELRDKVLLVPMEETKYEAGMRVFRYEY
jgi:adenylate cyclase class IV